MSVQFCVWHYIASVDRSVSMATYFAWRKKTSGRRAVDDFRIPFGSTFKFMNNFYISYRFVRDYFSSIDYYNLIILLKVSLLLAAKADFSLTKTLQIVLQVGVHKNFIRVYILCRTSCVNPFL